MLEGLGAEVSEAATGAQALEALEAGHFDVLLVDVGLPDISGEEVARRARTSRADLAIVFCTGRSEVAFAEGLEGCAVLQKPFSETQLISVIKQQEGFGIR
jgi:CheY-like chemotaxis protein